MPNTKQIPLSGYVVRDKQEFALPKAHVDAKPNVMNLTYIIRNILLPNINESCFFEKQSDSTDDYILRPVALFDIAYRDLQECERWPMDNIERKRYARTKEYCAKIFNRFYRGMSNDQIYMLNNEMEKMEQAIKHDYDILYIQVLDALRAGFADEKMRLYTAKLCVIHVCVDLPMKYLDVCLGGSRIRELDFVSHNVNLMMRYYATNDQGVEGDINLNHSNILGMAMKAFQNRFFMTKMVGA